MKLEDFSVLEFTNSKKETLTLKQFSEKNTEIKKVTICYLNKAGEEKELVIDKNCSLKLGEDNYHVTIRYSDKELHNSITDYDKSTLRKVYVFNLYRPHKLALPGGNIISLEW